MSAEPRAYRRSSTIVGSNGSLLHSWSSTGTVSVWPDRTRPGFGPSPIVAKRLAFAPLAS